MDVASRSRALKLIYAGIHLLERGFLLENIPQWELDYQLSVRRQGFELPFVGEERKRRNSSGYQKGVRLKKEICSTFRSSLATYHN